MIVSAFLNASTLGSPTSRIISNTMAIKTSTFGRVELSGNEAVRFLRHMAEDKPNPQAQATLVRGRAVLRQLIPTTALSRTPK